MPEMKKTRDVFLWCMSVVYLFAFASLYVQIPGLYGDNGVLPAKLALNTEANSWQELLDGQPTLLKLTPKLGLDVQTGMDLLCLGGILISFFCMVCRGGRDVVSFTLLWMLYLSMYQVGQTFMWFQWDILLLEAGFLTILIAPFKIQIPKLKFAPSHRHDKITMWLVKWLLFRLMFASGVVKLNSKCPTWWGLTALTHHFETQCIPTTFAWFWHQFPTWFLKLSCALTYVIEIPIPFLFFAPVRSLRIFAFFAQLLLQVCIIITGNYNFFNLLTITLCIPLLDDKFFGERESRKKKGSWSVLRLISNIVAPLAVLGYLGYQTIRLFSIKLNNDNTIDSKIAFTERDFSKWLEFIMPYTIGLGIISLGYEVLMVLISCLVYEKKMLMKFWSVLQAVIFASLAVGMFTLSLVPHSRLDGKTHSLLWPSVHTWHKKLDTFRITDSYGLFRVMTGVKGRPEVIIEGSNDLDKDWKEYHFLYKPGNVSAPLPFVAPHQPRLDWQMWFAALGSYQNNPWFVNLIYRLLTNQKEVLELMHKNPFPVNPPKYIRATMYHYYFTSSDTKNKLFSKRNWWSRKKMTEYISVLSKDEPTMLKYLQHERIIGDKSSKELKIKSTLGNGLLYIRGLVGQPEGFKFVMSIFGSGLLVNLLNVLIF
ncbi:lipase maturation factor 2 isoform X2 [Patella vulgata]|uniref:lipase maturation factor 2 isoform X2 n=1 Tax=Patella vulgata TaxID=6465 RepID=UPI0021809270|nr:lipase maturation factor 2 isoform X2 [Patella vulgata]